MKNLKERKRGCILVLEELVFTHAFHFIEKLKSSFAGATITAPDIEVTAAQCGVVVKTPTFITNFNVSW